MLSNGILFSHKELSCAIYRDMNGPRDCHTELRKSEREKINISHNIAYICNLEKSYRWTYLQSRNRNNRECTYGYGVEGCWDELEVCHWHIYTAVHNIDN